MEKLPAFKENIPKNTFLISFFYVCFFLFHFYKDYTFELTRLDSVIFSDANAYGTDINTRVNLFYKLLGFGVPFFFICISLFQRIFKRYQFNSNEYLIFHLFGILGLTAIITQIVGTKNEVLIYLLFWVSLFRLLTLVISKTFTPLRILKNDTLFYLILSSSFLIYYLLVFLFHVKNIEQCVGFILLGSFLLYFLILSINRSPQLTIRKIAAYLTPLTLISPLSFIVLEGDFFYYKIHHDFFEYNNLFLIIFISSFFCIFIFLLKKKKYSTSTSLSFKRFFGPSVLLAFSLMVFYQPIIEFTNETFELANSTNAMLRIFKFHQLPFVDYLSSHLLYEQWYGILYNIIFGYKNTLDFTIYAFFNKLILIFALYYFFNTLFKNSFLSVIFILSFHYIDYVFFQHVFLCIFLFFIFQKAIEKNKTWNYFFLFFFTFLLIFYRLDTGIVGGISMMLFLPIWYVTSDFKIAYKSLWKAIVITFGVISCIGILALTLRGKKVILENATLALHYISSNQAHGLHALSVNYPHQFQLYHLIFPLITAIIFVYILSLLYKNKKEKCFSKTQTYIVNTILFLAILFIINFQRGVVRHGFTEENEFYLISTFFVILSLFVVFVSNVKNKTFQFSIFYSVLFTSFILFKYFPLPKESSYFDRAIKQNTFRNIHLSLNKKEFTGRVIEDSLKSIHRFDSLISYLDSNLTKNQTFLDFSNTPILYYYANKFIPGYFNQNLQNTVDEYTQLQLLKEVNPHQVPIVIYSNHPLTWFDQTDNIPNPVRYNLLSEYIHKNYTPYKIINGKSIWIAKHLKVKSNSQCETIHSHALPIHYRRLAEYIGDYYQRKNYEKLGVIYSTRTIQKIKKDTYLIPVPFSNKSYHHCYIDIVFSKKSNEKLAINLQLLDSNDYEIGDFYFENFHTSRKHFFLRVSNSYLWHVKEVKNLKLYLNQGDLLEKVTFYNDLRFEN